tara:strand:- start:442 stop:1032 length:591 start_codon:yes stop_codon:yes gene_type:complete
MAAAMRQRRCIVTGEVSDDSALIRFVAGPDGAIVPDIEMKLPGRGAWIVATRKAVASAAELGLLARSLGDDVRAPVNLAVQVETLLVRRCLDLVGLARRAGEVAMGFSKVRAWLRSGRTGVVLHARDGSQREYERLMSSKDGFSEVTLFTGEELGLALGRESVVHAAMSSGGFTDRLLRDVSRLNGFRESGGFSVD